MAQKDPTAGSSLRMPAGSILRVEPAGLTIQTGQGAGSTVVAEELDDTILEDSKGAKASDAKEHHQTTKGVGCIPAEFFQRALGPRVRRNGCCLWSIDEVRTLQQCYSNYAMRNKLKDLCSLWPRMHGIERTPAMMRRVVCELRRKFPGSI